MAKILLVEDDEFVCDMLSQMLTRASHEVRSAKDGEAALAVLQNFSPNLLITDIIMPKKSGTELIAEVKAKHPDMEMIAISGGGRADPIGYLDLSEELGASLSFPKPVDHEALLMAIDLLLVREDVKE